MVIKKKEPAHLIHTSETTIRFSEVDSMRIVWHGNYIVFFEDGREAFGKQYGIGYLDMHAAGLMTPVVEVSCQYKKQLYYGDTVIIETQYIDTDAAKILFHYNLYRKSDHGLVATGKSVQVFLDKNGELLLTIPDYINEWKRKHGLLKG
jgi:acyl-CoA thioester hydrolase